MRKNDRLFVLGGIFVVVYLLTTLVRFSTSDNKITGDQTIKSGLATSTITLGGDIFTVELAQTHEERVVGLSGRENLVSDGGMLFIFPESDYHGIWMKDMRLALDILWLDEKGAIVSLEENVEPDTFPTVFKPSASARFVLELPAGTCGHLGLSLGEIVSLPASFRAPQ